MSKFSGLPWLFGILVGSTVVVSRVAAQEVRPIEPATPQTESQTEAQVADWFEQHRDQPPLMRAFVQRMPKGGDIHSHLGGAVYAEHYLEWAAADGYCVDMKEEVVIEPKACGQDSAYFPASELLNRTADYDALINDWSTRNLAFAEQSGHDQFFQAFGGFAALTCIIIARGDREFRET